ncbi:MAG: hypothetical protein OSA89_20375, partial [Mariniblastus sp.]|nr:hypothetical protein [Mariniblastus sp.]
MLSGKTLVGTIKAYRGADVVLEIKVGARNFQQRFPKSKVHAITIGTKRTELNAKPQQGNPSTRRV